jgi:plastocyanin
MLRRQVRLFTAESPDLIMKKYLVLFVVLVFLVIASGCTQSPAPVKPTATPSPSITQITSVSATPTFTKTPSVSDNTITINKSGFYPASMTVKSGSTVRWLNADSTKNPALYNPTHRITVNNVDGQLISPGQSWSWIFYQPGTYPYSDMLQPDLVGTVIVV